MLLRSARYRQLLSGLFVLVMALTWQHASAQDVVHSVSGVVKSIDKDAKTVVVKTSDGTEHTIKDTGKGVEKASADTYLGTKVGTKVTVNYTEKAGEKTAVGIKDAGKATGKAATQ